MIFHTNNSTIDILYGGCHYAPFLYDTAFVTERVLLRNVEALQARMTHTYYLFGPMVAKCP